MSEWVEKELGTILGEKGYIRGPFGSSLKRNDLKSDGIPVYEQMHAIYNHRNFRFFVDQTKFQALHRFQVKTNDLIISCSGTVGRVSTISSDDPKGIISQALLILRPDIKQVYPAYLKYFLISPQGQYQLLSASHGSVQPNISERKIVQQIPVSLPSLEIQKEVVEVLSSLDDKIDLLHRQNKTLEQLAETLFRQWFVEDGRTWDEAEISDLAVVQNGFAFKSSEYVEEHEETYEVFKMGHISPGGGLRTTPKADFVPKSDRLSKWVLKKGDIVLAMTDMKDNVVILGVPAQIDKNSHYVLNQRVCRIYLKSFEKLTSQLFLYYQMADPDFIQLLQSTASSGVQVNLSTDAIKKSRIKIPPVSEQKKMLPVFEGIAAKLELNRKQAFSLQTMRDTLLPKLMSGQVKVNLDTHATVHQEHTS